MNDNDAKVMIYALAESVCQRMRENGFAAGTVEISVRDKELNSFTRQHKLENPTFLFNIFADECFKLF